MSHDTFNPAEITQAPICECGDECMREPGDGRACRFVLDYGPRCATSLADGIRKARGGDAPTPKRSFA